MKKIVALLCAVLLLSVSCAAMAQTVYTQPAEMLRPLLAGKTLTATVNGYTTNSKGLATLYISLFEKAHFAAEDVKALQAGDTLFSPTMQMEIKSIEADELGYTITGEWGDVQYLYPDDNGVYYMVSETEETLWLNVIQLECYIADDFEYVDASDEEAGPVVRANEELIADYNGPKVFSPDNMQITFDDNCRVVRVTYLYSPWN